MDKSSGKSKIGEIEREFNKELSKQKELVPYSAIQVYATPREYLEAFFSFFKAKENMKSKYIQSIQNRFVLPPDTHILLTLSVRTSFSLFLEVMNYPKGSEIIMTAINILDMCTIIEEHGLIPVPVDITLETAGPTLQDVKDLITPKTKAIMLSYIFGVVYPIDDIIELCESKGIKVLEDAAEAFQGPRYIGHPKAHMTFYSFGSIKRQSAFSCAISFVRENDLYCKMDEIHNTYPVFDTKDYLRKLLRVLPFALVLNNKIINRTFRRLGMLFDVEYKEMGVASMRGFKNIGKFLNRFKKQPCVQMLYFFKYRLSNFDQVQYDFNKAKLDRATERLRDAGVKFPGYKIKDRGYWLYPLVFPDQKLCYDILNKRGVDAYKGATQLKNIPIPRGKEPTKVRQIDLFFNNLLYMPLSDIVPEFQIKKIVKEIIYVHHIVSKFVEEQKLNPIAKL